MDDRLVLRQLETISKIYNTSLKHLPNPQDINGLIIDNLSYIRICTQHSMLDIESLRRENLDLRMENLDLKEFIDELNE